MIRLLEGQLNWHASESDGDAGLFLGIYQVDDATILTLGDSLASQEMVIAILTETVSCL